MRCNSSLDEILAGIAIALFYQYELNQEPCVLCIHIRIWFFAILLVATIALTLPRQRVLNIVMHTLNTTVIIGLFWKCRELLGVERGTIESSCMINAGLPKWFDLERWLPTLFEVRGLCGQSPDMMLGISMAEALYVSSLLASIISGLMILAATYSLTRKT